MKNRPSEHNNIPSEKEQLSFLEKLSHYIETQKNAPIDRRKFLKLAKDVGIGTVGTYLGLKSLAQEAKADDIEDLEKELEEEMQKYQPFEDGETKFPYFNLDINDRDYRNSICFTINSDDNEVATMVGKVCRYFGYTVLFNNNEPSFAQAIQEKNNQNNEMFNPGTGHDIGNMIIASYDIVLKTSIKEKDRTIINTGQIENIITDVFDFNHDIPDIHYQKSTKRAVIQYEFNSLATREKLDINIVAGTASDTSLDISGFYGTQDTSDWNVYVAKHNAAKKLVGNLNSIGKVITDNYYAKYGYIPHRYPSAPPQVDTNSGIKQNNVISVQPETLQVARYNFNHLWDDTEITIKDNAEYFVPQTDGGKVTSYFKNISFDGQTVFPDSLHDKPSTIRNINPKFFKEHNTNYFAVTTEVTDKSNRKTAKTTHFLAA
ncbi:hypothetical protein KJ855_01125 [Patescibacteria group bacterium]|nr:hypothetical protein [Patescibacteria group bacterium]